MLKGLPSWVSNWNCKNDNLSINDGHVKFSSSKETTRIIEESLPQYLVTEARFLPKPQELPRIDLRNINKSTTKATSDRSLEMSKKMK